MKKRRPNYRRVKIHRNYTIEDIARLFGIHKNTVRHWIKEGLETINDKRPILILGPVLKEFLQIRRLKNKQTCKPDELYCLRCRTPKLPAERWRTIPRLPRNSAIALPFVLTAIP